MINCGLLKYLILILNLDFSFCLINESIKYDILEYNSEIMYTLNNPNITEMEFYIKMNVDSILTNPNCLINIRQTDPQKIILKYKFENGQETSEFKEIKNWLTINDGNQHVLEYEIEKPKDRGYTLYMNVIVSKYKLGQKVTVISTDHQFNFFLLIILIVAGSSVLVGLVIFATYYCVYKKGVDPNEINDIIFAKVGPEDY
jgi:hypothetical protein